MDRTSRGHKRHPGNRKITYKTAGNAEITVIHDETAPKEQKNVFEVIFQGNKEVKKYPYIATNTGRYSMYPICRNRPLQRNIYCQHIAPCATINYALERCAA